MLNVSSHLASVKMENITIDELQVGKVDKIVGKITNLTEIKTKNRTKYFNFRLRDETGTISGVCFDSKKHAEISNETTYSFENVVVNDNE